MSTLSQCVNRTALRLRITAAPAPRACPDVETGLSLQRYPNTVPRPVSAAMRQPKSVKALEELGRVQLSENFFLRDFL